MDYSLEQMQSCHILPSGISKIAITSATVRLKPKQSNTSTITEALSSVPNTCTKASMVANASSATQISSGVAVNPKPNASRRSINTSSPNAAIHPSHTVGSIGGSGVSPPFVLLSSLPLPLPIIVSPLLPTEPEHHIQLLQ